MSVTLNKTKLVPLNVGLKESRLKKTLKYNNYFYELSRVKSEYPMELAFAQISQLSGYDVAIIKSNDLSKKGYYVVFLKTPTRATMIVNEENLLIQINRLKEMFDNIAIINENNIETNSEYTSNSNKYKNVHFLTIRKLPDLIDDRKKIKIIRNYIVLFFIVFALFISFLSFESKYNDNLIASQKKLKTIKLEQVNTTKELNSFNKVLAPGKEERIEILENILKLIKDGEIISKGQNNGKK